MDQWNPKLYDGAHNFVYQLGQEIVTLLDPKAGESILDLGCGTGALTQEIARSGATVSGIDASPAMIAQAREKFPSLVFEVMDATKLAFDQQFDAVFSNAVLHWVKPPERAAERMFAALKPGGRLVLEMGGLGNVSAILQAAIQAGDSIGADLRSAVNINYFPSIAEYSTVLENAGFHVGFAALFDRPTPLTEGHSGLRNWIHMFRPGVETVLAADKREAFFSKLDQLCRRQLFRDGAWYADYCRLRVTARRPAAT